ncbi:MAG TPA: hypothetical protein VNW72_07375 [Chthoniobacterales bacterium]|nr:hypothetical protein [Chthoniobacterales bacterium]
MKKYLLIAAVVCISSLAAVSTTSAQTTALFIYDNGTGTPSAGTYTPGSSFTFAINLGFVPGGSVANLDGVSYWFQQTNPSIAPFPFSITLRDVTGSMFTDLQTPGLTYPQNLNPVNANDLGGAIPVNQSAVGAGTYLVADITVSIALSAPTTGVFTISNTTSGGKTSVISDSFGHTFAIPEADYIITMIPEPATWLTPALGLAALLLSQRRRISKLCRAA